MGRARTISMANRFSVGDRVYFGRPNGEQTLGEVVKVNLKSLKVKQVEVRGTFRTRAVGTLWKVPPSLCRLESAGDGKVNMAQLPLPVKRSDDVILEEISGVYSDLSPENLTCDGELSQSQVMRRGAALNRKLRACFAELGRTVSEEEIWKRWQKNAQIST